MANNPQYTGGPGPPLRPPMVGSIGPPQNIPPPMPTQFWSVAPMHPSQQFAPSAAQQYQSIGPGIPVMNLGMPPSQNQQMQFTQPLQVPARPIPPGHLPPMSQSVPLSNIQLNRPMSSGLPQPVQNLQAPSSFSPATGGPGMPPLPAYNPNAYPTSQYQPVSQMNLQSIPVSGQPLSASGNQDAASFTPLQKSGQPPPSISTSSVVDCLPKTTDKSSSDWLEHTNNGRRFYYNKKTRLSTWEKPFELMTPLERADATTDWKEYTGPDGRKYYYNKVTKQSKWVIPEELKLARAQAEKASCVVEVAGSSSVSASHSSVKIPSTADVKSCIPVIHSSPARVTPVAMTGVATSPIVSSPGLASLPLKATEVQKDALSTVDVSETVPGNADEQVASANTAPSPMNQSNVVSTEEAVESLQNVVVQEAEEDNKSTGVNGKTSVSASEEKVIESETVTYATKQEAKDAFKALLESANVESDWTWEQAMRLIINDKRYAALRSLGERKQAFNEYLIQKRKHEAEERRVKNRKAKEGFKKMLEECSELTSTTRWGKAITMFGNDERFKAIERARDREDMFEEYVAELEKKERAKQEEERQRNIMEYRNFLESCDFIKANSQWRKVKDRLEGDQRCSRLDTMDQLKIFQEYVGDLEKEEEEQKRIQKEEARKAERRNRDEFRKLMEGHVSDGTLIAKTLWREYHAKVKDSSAYIAVSSNSSGSTPKELFEDVVEELKKQYEEDKARIKDAVKSGKAALSSTWTLEDFKAAIENEISFAEVSENNLQLVFDELLERAREKEEKEAKRQKRLGDEFFNMLCSLKDITVDSKWEDCLPLFEAREEFRSIVDEAFSKQIFEEYLEQLKEKEEKDRKRKEEKAKREKERERDKRSRDKRDKDRRRDRDRGKERSGRDEVDAEPDIDDTSVANQSRKSGKDKEKKHRKRHQDDENDSSLDKNGKDHSRSSHRHSSERKKSRQMEQHTESDNESKHKKSKREHRNGSRRKGDNDELEDGELGNC